MSLVTLIRPNFEAIEEDFVNSWRVWNGEQFVYGFPTKAKAIEFAKALNGSVVAYCTKVDDEVVYKDVVEIEP